MPKDCDIFGVHKGDYAGELWIFCSEDNNNYQFLAVPVMVNRKLDKPTFDIGIESGIVKHIKSIPSYVFETSKLQYLKNEK